MSIKSRNVIAIIAGLAVMVLSLSLLDAKKQPEVQIQAEKLAAHENLQGSV